MMLVVNPGYCLRCGKKVSLHDAAFGREQLSEGAERIFFICPYCGEELEDEIVPDEKIKRGEK